MRRTLPLLASALIALIPGVARADIAKVVPTGTTRQIDFFASIHPDCSPTGTPVVRLIDGPSKGSSPPRRAAISCPSRAATRARAATAAVWRA